MTGFSAAKSTAKPSVGRRQPVPAREHARGDHGLVVRAHRVDDLLEVHKFAGLHGLVGVSHDEHVFHGVLLTAWIAARLRQVTISSRVCVNAFDAITVTSNV